MFKVDNRKNRLDKDIKSVLMLTIKPPEWNPKNIRMEVKKYMYKSSEEKKLPKC